MGEFDIIGFSIRTTAFPDCKEYIKWAKEVLPDALITCGSYHCTLAPEEVIAGTVAAMEETIVLLRKECPWAKVCVGGAVMTQEYADQIGADFYGKDAMDTVRYANNLFTK